MAGVGALQRLASDFRRVDAREIPRAIAKEEERRRITEEDRRRLIQLLRATPDRGTVLCRVSRCLVNKSKASSLRKRIDVSHRIVAVTMDANRSEQIGQLKLLIMVPCCCLRCRFRQDGSPKFVGQSPQAYGFAPVLNNGKHLFQPGRSNVRTGYCGECRAQSSGRIVCHNSRRRSSYGISLDRLEETTVVARN